MQTIEGRDAGWLRRATLALGVPSSCLHTAIGTMGEPSQLLVPTTQQAPGSHTLAAHHQHANRALPTPAATRAPSPATVGALRCLPLACCPTSALPNNAQTGKQSRPNAVNELIHEGYWRTKGAQTAPGRVTLGACFATLTPRGRGQQAARSSRGQPAGSDSISPSHPASSSSILCQKHWERTREGWEGAGPSVSFVGHKSHSCLIRTMQAQNCWDRGTWGLAGDLGTALSVFKEKSTAGAEA